MVAIGDVFGIVALLVGLGVTAWAMMITCALMFPGKIERARLMAEDRFGRSLGLGVVTLIPGVIGVMLLSVPHPLVKLIGWVAALAVLAVAAVGAAGLGQVAAKTLRRMSPEMAEYPAFVRGCAFLVTAAMLPILGWFVLGPIVLLVSMGCGAQALLVRYAPPKIMHGMV